MKSIPVEPVVQMLREYNEDVKKAIERRDETIKELIALKKELEIAMQNSLDISNDPRGNEIIRAALAKARK